VEGQLLFEKNNHRKDNAERPAVGDFPRSWRQQISAPVRPRRMYRQHRRRPRNVEGQLLFEKNNHRKDNADRLCKYGCKCCARCVHVQTGNQNEVADDVDDTCDEQVSFLALCAFVNRLGLEASSGYGVACKIVNFAMLIPSSLMQSMASFVSQNVG